MKMGTGTSSRRRIKALHWAPLVLAAAAAPSVYAAEVTLPPLSLGAGLRTSFTATNVDGGADSNDFALDSVRLYLSGSATDTVKFTFNTEYTGSPPNGDDKVIVMDAIARFEYSSSLNIWAGRFLPPSDRANLYGPYYANHWAVYTDGVQDGYAAVAVGRDNGVAYWGDFGGLKVSAGVFDVPATTAPSPDANKVIVAARAMYDFWDKESGYYLNSTYYGGKDLFAIGVAGQGAGGDNSYSADLLIEKNLGAGGVITLESEYAKYKGLTGGGSYGAGNAYGQPIGSTVKSSGAYALVSYLFPQPVGIGKIQVLGKYAEAKTDIPGPDPKQKTTEFDVGYIVKEFNVRGYLFYVDKSFDNAPFADATYTGVGLQIQI